MQKDKAKISIYTLGCKVNQCDSSAISECLENAGGYEIVPFDSDADLSVINTCVVTAKTEAQSRQIIRRVLKRNPLSKVVVTGCYAQKAPDDLMAISEQVFVVGNREKKDMPYFVAMVLDGQTAFSTVSDISNETTFTTPAFRHFFDRTRAFLKIQDGCNAGCAYCIVPLVRGRSRSLALKDAMSRMRLFVKSGYREIVLTGIHLGAYGLDLTPSSSISELLESIESDKLLTGIRVRLSSIEPTEFSDELIKFVSESKTICPSLHIPLQSGDINILRRMGRQYTPDYYKELIDRIVGNIPGVNMGVDVIAGFPGETDEQFQNTVSLIESIPVGYLHVFPYSKRQDTAAARFKDHVSESVKKQRVRVLRNLSAVKKHSFYSLHIGRNLFVLVEGRRDKETGLLKGFSRNYIPVLFDGPDNLFGKELSITVTEVQGEKVYGIKRNK
jgi:threonylcarbamoyladenosine tRNA methylthiotransferase MtaB